MITPGRPLEAYLRLHFSDSCLSLVAQMAKCLSAMQETQVRSLGWGDPLEKEMAAYSSILAWKILWTVEPGTVHGVTKSRTRLSHFTSLRSSYSYEASRIT